MTKRQPTPMSKPHRVVQVPTHTRNGRTVKGHTRRVLLKPPVVTDVNTGGYGSGGYAMFVSPTAGLDGWPGVSLTSRSRRRNVSAHRRGPGVGWFLHRRHHRATYALQG